ncbi:MAG: 50S ribosomal protein L23 [Candidatus Liptonbacteria bacterium]|nr:50S ribosomal protein L23 [Candidatus Liptonbacteria bacterium]
MRDPFIIKSIIVSEKATDLNTARKYVFMVQPSATKREIKKAVEDLYAVKVAGVHTVQRPPKPKRYRARVSLRGGYKKAIVTLREGQSIDTGR